MKFICALTVAALLSSWLAVPPVFAQGAGIEWDILNQEVTELYRAGNYGRAVVVAKKALQVAEANAGKIHPMWPSLNNLAQLYATQGQYAQAEPLYKRTLAIKEKALGPDHPDVAMSLNNLAQLYDTQGQYAQAGPLYKRAGDQGKGPRPRPSRCGHEPQQPRGAVSGYQPGQGSRSVGAASGPHSGHSALRKGAQQDAALDGDFVALHPRQKVAVEGSGLVLCANATTG